MLEVSVKLCLIWEGGSMFSRSKPKTYVFVRLRVWETSFVDNSWNGSPICILFVHTSFFRYARGVRQVSCNFWRAVHAFEQLNQKTKNLWGYVFENLVLCITLKLEVWFFFYLFLQLSIGTLEVSVKFCVIPEGGSQFCMSKLSTRESDLHSVYSNNYV